MKIAYLEDGTITEFAPDTEKIPGTVLHVPDQELPEDFSQTFGLGKYQVKNKKVVAVKGFQPEEKKPLKPLPSGKKKSNPSRDG